MRFLLFLLVLFNFSPAIAEQMSYESFFVSVEGWSVDETKTDRIFDDVTKYYKNDDKEILVWVYYKSPSAMGANMKVDSYKSRNLSMDINGYDAHLDENNVEGGRPMITVKVSGDTAVLIQQSEESKSVQLEELVAFAKVFDFNVLR